MYYPKFMRFLVFTAVKMTVMVIWVMMLLSLGGYQHFGATYCFRLQGIRWRHYVCLKCW
jgi:hypothetical protein